VLHYHFLAFHGHIVFLLFSFSFSLWQGSAWGTVCPHSWCLIRLTQVLLAY
jgi:hypothetical protein